MCKQTLTKILPTKISVSVGVPKSNNRETKFFIYENFHIQNIRNFYPTKITCYTVYAVVSDWIDYCLSYLCAPIDYHIQWNPYIQTLLGPGISVLISVSSIRGSLHTYNVDTHHIRVVAKANKTVSKVHSLRKVSQNLYHGYNYHTI